jgi:hypothetical protein
MVYRLTTLLGSWMFNTSDDFAGLDFIHTNENAQVFFMKVLL